jgi:hypothetical protein
MPDVCLEQELFPNLQTVYLSTIWGVCLGIQTKFRKLLQEYLNQQQQMHLELLLLEQLNRTCVAVRTLWFTTELKLVLSCNHSEADRRKLTNIGAGVSFAPKYIASSSFTVIDNGIRPFHTDLAMLEDMIFEGSSAMRQAHSILKLRWHWG